MGLIWQDALGPGTLVAEAYLPGVWGRLGASLVSHTLALWRQACQGSASQA